MRNRQFAGKYMIIAADSLYVTEAAALYDSAIKNYLARLEEIRMVMLNNPGCTMRRNLVEINQKRFDGYLQLAILAADKHNYEGLYAQTDRILSDKVCPEPVRTRTLELVAESLMEQKKYTEAIYFFKQLTMIKDRSAYGDRIERIYLECAREALGQSNFMLAGMFIETLVDLSSAKNYLALKDSVIAAYAASEIGFAENAGKSAEQYRLYENALNLLNRLKREEAEDKQLKNKAYFALSKLSEKDKKYDAALDYLNRVSYKIAFFSIAKEVKERKISIYLAMAQELFRKKDYLGCVDYLNKILADFPDHEKANQLKSEIRELKGNAFLTLGTALLENRQYEEAEYFLRSVAGIDQEKAIDAEILLGNLYKKTYLGDKAINSKKRYQQLLNSETHFFASFNSRAAEEANFELARLYAMKGDAPSAIWSMETLYSSDKFLDYASRSLNNSDFYNLRDNLYFKLWSNGLQRLKLQVHSLTNIIDQDLGPGISDPEFCYERGNVKLYSPVFMEKNELYLEDLYIIDDFAPGDMISLTTYDCDEGTIREGDEVMGVLHYQPFGTTINTTEPLYFNKKRQADVSISIARTYDEKSRSGFDEAYRYRSFNLQAGNYNKSCFQIGLEAGWELLKTQMEMYPFILVTVVETLMAQSEEATIEGVDKVASKYLRQKYASPKFRAIYKQYRIASILAEKINEMKKANCF